MEKIEKTEPYRISKLTQIIDEDVLQMFQLGFSEHVDDTLTIIQCPGTTENDIIKSLNEDMGYPEFCLYLKKNRDGKKRCLQSDLDIARSIFQENLKKPSEHFCHAGLSGLTFPIVVEDQILAVCLSGNRRDIGYAGLPEKQTQRLN